MLNRPMAGLVTVVLAGGCNVHPIENPGPLRTAREQTSRFCAPIRPAVDVLLVIDDSASMADESEILQSQLTAFMHVYESSEFRIDYRIAVTTTDTGNPRCDPDTADDGALLTRSCRQRLDAFATGPTIESSGVDVREAGCLEECSLEAIELLPTAAEPGGEHRPRPWIERIEGVSNVPPGVDPAEVLGCLGPPGVAGCPFESPLEAARQAFLRAFDPNDPAYGFLRPRAALFILFITDEPDCSYRAEHGDIFEPGGSRVFWSDPDAEAPTSAVCWNAGVQCSGGPDVYDDCWPAHHDADGRASDPDDAVLTPVQIYGDLLAAVEQVKIDQGADPSGQRVFVHVLGGVPTGVALQPGESPGYPVGDDDQQAEFGIGPGCTTEERLAYPPLRLEALAEAFTPSWDQPLFSTCHDDWTQALACLPGGDTIRPWCFEGCVADSDPDTVELEPTCTVTETVGHPDGSLEEQRVPPCTEVSGDETCWTPLTGGEMSSECLDRGANLEIQVLRSGPANNGACIEVTCTTSSNRAEDCPNRP